MKNRFWLSSNFLSQKKYNTSSFIYFQNIFKSFHMIWHGLIWSGIGFNSAVTAPSAATSAITAPSAATASPASEVLQEVLHELLLSVVHGVSVHSKDAAGASSRTDSLCWSWGYSPFINALEPPDLHQLQIIISSMPRSSSAPVHANSWFSRPCQFHVNGATAIISALISN